MLAVAPGLAAALHPGRGIRQTQACLLKYFSDMRQPTLAQLREIRRDALLCHRGIERIGRKQLAGVHPELIGRPLQTRMTLGTAVTQPHDQIATAAQVIADFLDGFFGNRGNPRIR